MEQQYYSINEVATILNLHPTSIKKLINEGIFKAVKLGGVYRLPSENLIYALETNLVSPKENK